MLYLGIDPGKNGGLALIDELGNPDHFCRMPETPKDLASFLVMLRLDGKINIRAAMEFVRASPQMGVCSAFTFGRGVGVLEGVFAIAGIPIEEVRPQTWQKAIGCMTKGDKNVSKRKAQDLFPSVKMTHSIADSFLIAEWLRRRETKNQ